MTVRNGLASIAKRLGIRLKSKTVHAGVAILAGSAIVCGSAAADEVAFDDFEGLKLQPWSFASGTTDEEAYNGWSAMDVDSWIAEQGGQERDACGCLGSGTNNTLLVADPDAWDDFTAGAASDGFNSFISRSYDLSGFDVSTLIVSFDYEFRIEDSQEGSFEISFDGGATFVELLRLGPVNPDGSNDGVIIEGSPASFMAGTDFTPTGDQIVLKFGCFNAGNDWWFAVDNVLVTADAIGGGAGFEDFEDFEGLPLEPFTAAGGGDGTDWTKDIRSGTDREWTIDNSQMVDGVLGDGDGTDWTRTIPNWAVDNSGMEIDVFEEFYNGWAAVDYNSWEAEQGQSSQIGLIAPGQNNTFLLADPDAAYDYVPPGSPSPGYNSFVSRTYDLSRFDSTTIRIECLYEYRAEDTQTGLIDVSFDGGQTFTNLRTLNVDTIGNEAPFQVAFVAVAGDPAGPIGSPTGFPAVQSNVMTLRFGMVESGNDWWFAVDNVMVEADPSPLVLGDANGDGEVTLLDVDPFVQLLTAGVYVEACDVNEDGSLTLLDVDPFVQLLTGG
jgi:hypothetical protein